MSETAEAVELEVVHETRYSYAAPVTQAQHLAYLKPLHDARQRLLAHELHIDPPPPQVLQDVDGYGNARALFSLSLPHRALSVRACSRVVLVPAMQRPSAEASPRWEDVRQRLRYEAGARYDAAVEFAQPSPYVPRLQVLRDYGAASFGAGVPLAVGALELMHRIHADFEFRSASTDIDTPLLQAYEQRSGVCQDFAHLMIGCLRSLGIPARYVSGYLRSAPSPVEATDAKEPEDTAFVGAEASHAWVSFFCPANGWVDVDPTNDLVPGEGHIVLAWGRDYEDVSPVKGVTLGGGGHEIRVAVEVRPEPTALADGSFAQS